MKKKTLLITIGCLLVAILLCSVLLLLQQRQNELAAVTPPPTATPAPEPSPTPTPSPTPEPTPEPLVVTVPPTDLSGSGEYFDSEDYYAPMNFEDKYYVMVNCTTNTVNVYSKDGDGLFTVPETAFLCSTGPATPTKGVYSMGWRLRWQTLFGGVYGQYVTMITGNILFHSVPYEVKYDPATLQWEEFDKLGESASMGCVRLQITDAKWIYDNADSIFAVEFYENEDPGPFGIPEVQKIGENEACRNWDPGDPDPANPWLDK